MALDENLVQNEPGHIAAHAALKAEYVAAGATPAIADYTATSTAAEHAAILNALGTRHNALGAPTTLATNLTATSSGLLAYETALNKAYNARANSAALPVTSGLRAHWKADAISSAPADGAALTTWTDSSGNSRDATQATAANKPIYRTSGAFLANGKPCVEFTQATPTWLTATVANNGATTRFIALRHKTVAGAGGTQAITSSSGGYELLVNGTAKLQVDVPNVAALGLTPTPATVGAGTWFVYSFDSNGSNLHHSYFNGTLDGTSTTSATATATTMDIGARGGTASLGANVYIAEIVDYSRVLTSTERAQVGNYLSAKYAIAVQPSPGYLDFDWDASANQAFTHPDSGWKNGTGSNQSTATHQWAWLTSPTRLNTGHSLRFEIHNNTADRWPGNTTYRSMMTGADTNEGGDSVGGAVGYNDVYWTFSSYFPTAAVDPTNGTVSTGFSQTAAPQYTHLWVIHERGNINGSTVGINNLGTVNNHSVMTRVLSGVTYLEFRQRCGAWTWNSGSSTWNAPAWSPDNVIGTTGSNDRIRIPIVKPGSTDAVVPLDVWIDVIVHIRFSKTSTGLTEIWARQAGQTFTTSPGVTITGPTHKTALGSDGVTRSSADGESSLTTGGFMECGLYSGSGTWGDTASTASVHIMDELRRYSVLAEAKANWG